MSTTVRHSPYNSVPFYQKDLIQGVDGYEHPRRVKPTDGVEPGEYIAEYWWPVTPKQYVCLQFHRGYLGTTAWNYAVLNFYDKDGKFINYIDPTEFYTLPGNTDENGEQLYTIQFKFKPEDYAFLDDVELFSMRLIVHFGDGSAIDVGDTVYEFITDLIEQADEHEGTTLVSASNDTNTYDGTIFDPTQIAPAFSVRVPAGRLKPIPAGEYTVIKDQRGRTNKLYSEPVNKYSWDVLDVPFAVLDLLNYYLSCDTVKIGNHYYVLEEDGRGDSDATTPRSNKTYILSDKDIDKTLEYNEIAIPIWTRPASGYNYGITRTALYDGTNFINKLPTVFEDSGDEDDWITAVEAQKTAQGLTGEFLEVSGTFYYKNGPGEAMRLVLAPEVKPYELIVTFNIANAPRIPNIALYYPDGAVRNVIMVESVDNTPLVYNNFGTGNVTSISKTYGSNGTVVFRIFHNDEETAYGMNIPGVYPKVTDITGECSASLNKLEVVNCDFSGHTTFSLAFLSRARQLPTFIMRSSKIKGFTSGWASSLVTGSGSTASKPFPFRYVDIRYNEIPTSNLDPFINEFFVSCAWAAGINQPFLTVGQSPAAPPSASAANITTLETSYGFDFQTD